MNISVLKMGVLVVFLFFFNLNAQAFWHPYNIVNSGDTAYMDGVIAAGYICKASPTDYSPFGRDYDLISCWEPLGTRPDEIVGDNNNNTCYPVNKAVGNKFLAYEDFKTAGSNPIILSRYYNSVLNAWDFSYTQKLVVDAAAPENITVHRTDGSVKRFILDQGAYHALTPDAGTLQLINNEWEYVSKTGVREVFDSAGILKEVVFVNGLKHSINVQGSERTITDMFGNSIKLVFTAEGFLAEALDGLSSIAKYRYNTHGLLDLVEFESGVFVQYLYENTSRPKLLTKIIDESNRIYKTISYNANEQVISSALGDSLVEETFSYPNQTDSASQTVYTNRYGKSSLFDFSIVNGQYLVKQVEGQASINCVATNSFTTYDANGFKDKITNNEGYVTDYDYNTLGLVETITEGLQWQDPDTRTTLIQTPSTRTITTQWLLSTRQKDIVTTEGVITDYNYYPNNRLQTLTQTDTTSHTTPLGSTNGRQKVWTYTYTYHTVAGVAADLIVNEETIDGPLPGTADVTINQYDTAGNRISTTNALGHITTFANFNGRGQPQTLTDVNGVVTQMSYHPRGWLTKVTVKSPDGNALNDHITQYDYYANGTLQRVTQADGSYLDYSYNDARHLTSITNNLGESITYTPDAMGKWTLAQTKDSSGVIKRQQQRAFDELGRLMDTFGQNNQHTKLTYDKNSNPVDTIESGQTTTPTTTQNYDALDRLKTQIDPDLNTVTYDYDAQNNLTGVTDPRGLQTQYLYDGFNQLIQQTSPDTGTRYFWYDAAGNQTQKQDARGVTSTYTYDLLNRLTQQNYPAASAENITYTYDQTTQGENGIGRLTHIADPSGSTHYFYDHLGQIVKVDTQLMANTYTTQYNYNPAGQHMGITYPSGLIISYERDALGRIQTITANDAGQLSTLASNIQYTPFGPSSQMNYGNGILQTNQYDNDYRLSHSQLTYGLTSIQNLNYLYDWFNNITGLSDSDGLQRQQNFSYDLQHRLDTATDNLPASQGGYLSQDFDYDPVSNRTLLTTASGQTSYTYPLDSNRLSSDTQWNYEYDAAGNTTRRYDSNGNELQFTYNQRNRLSHVTHTTASGTTNLDYQYNGLGQRVAKQSSNSSQHYLYDLNGQLLVEADAQGTTQKEYVYFEGKPLAILDAVDTGPAFDLMLSSNPDRSAATALNTDTVSGNAYIFLASDATISQVRFYLDTTTGTPLQTENSAPYDLRGGTATAANAFDTTTLSDGVHSIHASITLADNTVVTTQADFSVSNTTSVPALTVSQSTSSFTMTQGSAAQSQTLILSTNDATTPAFTATENANWLSVQALNSTTPSDIQLTVDPSAVNLAPGTYSDTLTFAATGYTSAQHTVTLNVNSANPSAYTLMISSNPDRSAATALGAATVSGNAYIFLASDATISQVRFYLDTTTGTPLQTENSAPYDLRGGTATAANAFDTTTLSDGAHSIHVSITLADNTVVTTQADFTVSNNVVISNSTQIPRLASIPTEGPPDHKALQTLTHVASASSVNIAREAPYLPLASL